MTQGFPQQQNFGTPQYQQPPMPQQQYAPAAPSYGQPGAPVPQQAYAPAQPQYQQTPPMPQQSGTGGFFTQQDPHQQAQQQYAPPAPPQFQQPPPMPAQPVDTSSFFGGAATISWDDRKGYQVGTFRGGQILDKKIVPQTKMDTGDPIKWGDGTPRMQMVLTLQTAERADQQDNGQRQMFLKGDAPRAAREAFQAAGAKDLEVGGWYYQAWVDLKQPKNSGFNPQKIFKAVYAPPGSPDPMAGQQPYQPAPAQMQVPQQPAPGPIAQAPQQAMANFQQAAQVPPWQQPAEQFAPMVVNGVPQPHATPEQFAAYAAQQQAPVQNGQQFAQGQPVPYGALPGDLSAQQPQSFGQPANSQVAPQQPPGTPQGGAGYNPFG